MQVARHTRPEGHFKVWATNQLFFPGDVATYCGSLKQGRVQRGPGHLTYVDLLIRDTGFVTAGEISTCMRDREIWGQLSRNIIDRGHHPKYKNGPTVGNSWRNIYMHEGQGDLGAT